MTLEQVERLRSFTHDGPVLSVYLNVDAGRSAHRSVPARLKGLLAPIRSDLDGYDRSAVQSLLRDVDRVVAAADRLPTDGSGVAVFACGDADLFDIVDLPARVRSRAVVADHPYLRPVDAMLEELHRFCAVVIDRRDADIFGFHLGVLTRHEHREDEELRKTNYGGFSGYEERRVRSHADEVAQRLGRDTADRLFAMFKAGAFDRLLVGGQRESVDRLVDELHADLRPVLAGTFAIDTHTMTPAIVLDHCRRLSVESDRSDQSVLVARIMDEAAGGERGALGLGQVLRAVELRAVATLAVETDDLVAGTVCPACGQLAEGSSTDCANCGAGVELVPDVIDAAAAAVRDSGGEVRHVFGPTPMAEHRLGALLRFAVT